MPTPIFTGLFTALVTPFGLDGAIDFSAFARLLDTQLEAGIDGLVVLGTTAESPTLSAEEKLRLIKAAKEHCGSEMQIVVGTGTNNTQTTIQASREASELGADGLLVVSPYYNKPNQEGLFQHFSAVAEAVELPVMVYNIQGRTGVNIETPTLERLSAVKNICSVKEASGSLSQMTEVLESIASKRSDFSVLSGDDAMTFPLMTLGGQGVVSVASNVLPKRMAEMVAALNTGDFQSARELHFRLLPLFRGLFCDTNPAPAKALLAEQGICQEVLRAPLIPMHQELRRSLIEAELLF